MFYERKREKKNLLTYYNPHALAKDFSRPRAYRACAREGFRYYPAPR
jgi:hypothetical protein